MLRACSRLVEMGGSLTVEDFLGRTPLHMAARKGHAAAVKLLAELGSDLNHPDKNPWPNNSECLHARARTHTHTHSRAHARTHKHTRTHACTRAHARTCTHVHTHIQAPPSPPPAPLLRLLQRRVQC